MPENPHGREQGSKWKNLLLPRESADFQEVLKMNYRILVILLEDSGLV